MEDIQKKISDFIIEHGSLEKNASIDPSLSLFESGLIDSFGVFAMVEFIEREFKLKIDLADEGFSKIETINEIRNYISKHLGKVSK